MSPELQEMFVGIILAVIPVITGSVWFAMQRWSVRTLGNIIAIVVENFAKNRVHPMKMANQDNGGRYDLSYEQGRKVMEEAKQHVVEYAALQDTGKPWYKPALKPLVQNDKKLEERIERVVQERKRGYRPKGVRR